MMERYSEYKDSGVKWLGEIPSHWEVVRGLGVFSENKSKNTQLENSTVLSLSYGKIIVKKDIDSGLVPEEYSSYQIVRPGCIIVRSTDLQNDKTSLRIGYVCDEGIITSAYLGLQVKGNNNDKYLYYFLHDWDITKEIYRHGNGLRQSLSWNDLRDNSVLLPPLSEQDAIVRYLDSATSEIDKAIAMQQKMIDLLNERKQIIIQNAVTKGLDENVEMKESGVEWIGRIPKHWKVRKIKTVANFNPLPQRKFQQDEIVGYLPMERLGLGSMNPSEISYGKMPVGLNYIEDGDVVIAKVTPCFENGKIAIAKNLKNGCAFGTSEIFVYRPIKIDSVFLLYSLQNEQLKNKCASTMMGTGGLKRVNASFAKNVYITFPPTEKEQNEIGLFLENKISTFNKTIENIQRQITLLQERKQIIINEVVTGKVRVS